MRMKFMAVACLMALAMGGSFMMGKGLAPAQAVEEAQPKKKLRHVVFFKFEENASKEAIQKVEQDFAALPKAINAIKELEWGTNVSPEPLSQGYTHCFLLTFETEEQRDEYLKHPVHQEFGKSLGGVLAAAHVIDYWAQM